MTQSQGGVLDEQLDQEICSLRLPVLGNLTFFDLDDSLEEGVPRLLGVLVVHGVGLLGHNVCTVWVIISYMIIPRL